MSESLTSAVETVGNRKLNVGSSDTRAIVSFVKLQLPKLKLLIVGRHVDLGHVAIRSAPAFAYGEEERRLVFAH